MNNLKPLIKKNVSLAPLTSFGIGGPADFFCEAKSLEEIIWAVEWAKENNLAYFILGGGSNILVSDKGIKGLVIKIKSCLTAGRNEKIKIKNNRISVEAGTLLAKLLSVAAKHSLSGLEFLAGVPGTVGGAIAGNSGVKDKSIAQAIEKVKVLQENGRIISLSQRQCQFGYRKSRFQKNKEIILEAVFKLKKIELENIRAKINKALANRKDQPKGKSIGCIFKNPKLEPAGYLIDKAGLKGKRIGGARVSRKHANYIINLSNASSLDVLKLINLIKKKVKKDFRVDLEEEIRYLGNI